MSAIIRVKRRADEEPLDALVVNCKRKKTEASSSENDDEQSTLLKFAGTLESEHDDIFTHIRKSTKEELEDNYKKHFSNLKEKLRQQTLDASKNSRFRVVNLHRSTKQVDDKEDVDEPVTIVDIENKDESDSASKYVYDLYYTTSDDLGDVYEHDLVGVYPLSNELVYGSHRDNGAANDSEAEMSDDSNDENNWRNDYPEEEDNDSINESDIRVAVSRLELGSDNELSNDDGEEGFAYSIDSEGAGFEEEIDDSDVNRYGERYARFRAKHKEVLGSSSYSYSYEDGDSDPEYYY